MSTSTYLYSLVGLVWPNTEELIARLWVYERSDCCSGTIWEPRMLEISCHCSSSFFVYNFNNTHWLPWCWLQDFQVDFPCWGPQVFVREQILVNKSDKSDHPHQWEPWCFVEVVNKSEHERKTSSPQHSRCSYASGELIRINFHPKTAEKMAPHCMARLDLVNCTCWQGVK